MPRVEVVPEAVGLFEKVRPAAWAGEITVTAAQGINQKAVCRARRQTVRMAKPTSPASENDVLWISDNPRYGVVRRVLFCGDYAARFDDLNSDFREVELGLFERGATGWEKLSSHDDVDYPYDGGSPSYGESGGYQVYAYGRAQPRARVRIELYGGAWTVEVDADGWWLLVADAPQEGFDAAMEAYDARSLSIRAEIEARGSYSESSDGSGSDGFIVYERAEDVPVGLRDAFRSPLRVTVE